MNSNFIESTFCGDKIQIRFPHSKKSRIRNKWKKQEKNFKFTPWQHIIQYNGKFYGHPQTIRELKNGFQVVNSHSPIWRYI